MCCFASCDSVTSDNKRQAQVKTEDFLKSNFQLENNKLIAAKVKPQDHNLNPENVE